MHYIASAIWMCPSKQAISPSPDSDSPSHGRQRRRRGFWRAAPVAAVTRYRESPNLRQSAGSPTSRSRPRLRLHRHGPRGPAASPPDGRRPELHRSAAPSRTDRSRRSASPGWHHRDRRAEPSPARRLPGPKALDTDGSARAPTRHKPAPQAPVRGHGLRRPLETSGRYRGRIWRCSARYRHLIPRQPAASPRFRVRRSRLRAAIGDSFPDPGPSGRAVGISYADARAQQVRDHMERNVSGVGLAIAPYHLDPAIHRQCRRFTGHPGLADARRPCHTQHTTATANRLLHHGLEGGHLPAPTN